MVNRVLTLRAREKPKASWHQIEIESLPSLAKLARDGMLEFCYNRISIEEFWRKPGGFGSRRFGYLFAGINSAWVDAAITRQVLFQSADSKISGSKEHLQDFCAWLIDHADGLKDSKITKLFSEFEQESFNQLDRFIRICRDISPKHRDDAFQVWTGERNNIPYFVSTNRNFINAIRNDKKLVMACQPVLPTTLLDILEVTERQPMPYEYGEEYLLNGQRVS
jgi:hypothetical protein